jgi:hypothetical protein
MAASDDIVLMFAYHYPPDPGIGGARPYRFSKYLKRLGYRVHVIAAPYEGMPEADATYLPDPFYATPRDGAGWQAERFCRRFLLPGASGLRWARRAAAAARDFIRENDGHRITLLSTFPPVGTHVAAFLAARTEPVPWIADFRDPMGDRRAWKGATWMHQNSLVALERILMKRVDVVIANTDSALEHFQRKYPERAASFHLIWNGFDPGDRFGPIMVPGRREITLTYTGTLYAGRTAAPVLESLQRLFDAGRLRPDRIKVRLIGSADLRCLPGQEFLDRAAKQGWLDLREKVPRDEAITAMCSSDALLVVQPQTAVQVPGKIFEYLLTGHPILALVPRASPVEWILQNSGVPYCCVHPDQTRVEFDDTIAAFLSSDLRPEGPNAWFEANFNAARQAEELHELIAKLHACDARLVAI